MPEIPTQDPAGPDGTPVPEEDALPVVPGKPGNPSGSRPSINETLNPTAPLPGGSTSGEDSGAESEGPETTDPDASSPQASGAGNWEITNPFIFWPLLIAVSLGVLASVFRVSTRRRGGPEVGA